MMTSDGNPIKLPLCLSLSLSWSFVLALSLSLSMSKSLSSTVYNTNNGLCFSHLIVLL